MNRTPLPFTLRQLQYVATVAEIHSFRKAAELCHVSQPSLSSQIAEVERALGVRLFDRDRRSVRLTRGGQDLLARIRHLLVAADDLREASARLEDPLAGTVRLGIIPTISPYWLPEASPRLRRALPRLNIHWTEDKTPSLVAAIHQGALDGAVLALEAPLGELASEVVVRDPFLLVGRPDHPLLRVRRPIRTEELDGHELLVLAEGHCLRDQALAACAGALEAPFSATSLATLVQLVLGGDALTLLPALALELENRHGQLAVRRFVQPGPERTIACVWRRGASVAPTIAAIATAAREG